MFLLSLCSRFCLWCAAGSLCHEMQNVMAVKSQRGSDYEGNRGFNKTVGLHTESCSGKKIHPVILHIISLKADLCILLHKNS